MQFAVDGNALDCLEFGIVGLRRKQETGFDSYTIQHDGASTAVSGIASNVSPCQAKFIA